MVKPVGTEYQNLIEEFVSIVECDINVTLQEEDIRRAFDADLELGASLPSVADLEDLIMGRETEEGGDCEPPEELVKRYPNLNRLLQDLF